MAEPTRDLPPPALPTDTPHSSADTASDRAAANGPAPDSGELTPFATPPGYELLTEIGRGGMGVVYRARDTRLNRDVAVKLLQDRYAPTSLAAHRFVEEAQITGQLQHPGIPPVHEVGTLPNGRPFLAMKLIKGQTLSQILAEGKSSPGILVAAFEQVCQAVAYAHNHGVIHRDLKPANVMLGASGEVQVMDWGLAKFRTDARAESVEASIASTFHDPRDEWEHDVRTRTGSFLGTPSCMSPEQAIGAVDLIDERSDVFGLGAVLCVILTGQPPFQGDTAESTRQLAAQKRLGDALARLDSCGAAPDLIALCKHCLSPERDDRPRDAGEVARAVAGLRADAEQRARQSELDRVRAEDELRMAELKTAEQRKRRRVLLALFGTVALLLFAGGAFLWRENQLAERRRLRAESTRDGIERTLALSVDLRRQLKFEEAAKALKQGADRAENGEANELKPTVARMQDELAFVIELNEIRYRKWTGIPVGGGKGRYDTAAAPAAYRTAFLSHGLNLSDGDIEQTISRIRESEIRWELVDALDDWATYETDPQLVNRLLQVNRAVDPGAWTDLLRDPAVRADITRLEALGNQPDLERVRPAALAVLGALLHKRGKDPTHFLTAVQSRIPNDFQIAFLLGGWSIDRDPHRAIGYLRTARAILPNHPTVLNLLGVAHQGSGDLEGAIRELREAIRIAPSYAPAHYNLGNALGDRNEWKVAVEEFREAARLEPEFAAARNNLGVALRAVGDHAGAIREYEEAIRLDPNYAAAFNNLGNALRATPARDRAEAAFRKAIELKPDYGTAHLNLATLLQEEGQVKEAILHARKAAEFEPKNFHAHLALGLALRAAKKFDEAIAAFREAIALKPEVAAAHQALGLALRDSGDRAGAMYALRLAILLDPKDPAAYCNLGSVHLANKDPDAALVVYRQAIRVDPNLTAGHEGLALAWGAKGNPDATIASFRDALRLAPDNPAAKAHAHSNLGVALTKKGSWDEAIPHFREAVRLAPLEPSYRRNLDISMKNAGRVAPQPRGGKTP